MSKRSPLSVFLITCDEERHLSQVLSRIPHWVKDVVIVDSGSTDQTPEIARRWGARFIHHEWLGYGAQKRFAEEQCKNDWLLNLDGDEVMSERFVDNLTKLYDEGFGFNDTCGYYVQIDTIYPGDEKPRPWAHDYEVVRLYNKSAGRYRDHPLHDRVVFQMQKPKLGKIKGPIWHYNFQNWDHLVYKGQQLSTEQAKGLIHKPRCYLIRRLLFAFPLEFLRFYILKHHITGGWKGLIFSLIWAFFRTLRFAKALTYKEVTTSLLNGPFHFKGKARKK
jgi:glycosyltransferase involved in cell wall biosynthesis